MAGAPMAHRGGPGVEPSPTYAYDTTEPLGWHSIYSMIRFGMMMLKMEPPSEEELDILRREEPGRFYELKKLVGVTEEPNA